MIVLALIVGAALAVWLWARAELGRQRALLANSEALLAGAAERTALVERTQAQWEEHLKALTGDVLARSSSSLLALTDAKLGPIRE